MFSEKNIIVTIGDKSALVALYVGKEAKHKILIDELNSDVQDKLKKIFLKNKSADISILLDNSEQAYRRKTYPAVRKLDLKRIIKRDMSLDGDKDSIKNFIISENKKFSKRSSKRLECLFISSVYSENINQWISFLLEMPNYTKGIYMLPVEIFSLLQLLKKSAVVKGKIDTKRNDIFCLITQTRIGGLRQTIFSNKGIIFTRHLSYELSEEDAMEKYEHDIYSAFEYLKRLLPDLRISDFEIINILPKNLLDEIEKINNIELNFINLTPNKAAAETGYSGLLPNDSGYCDILISKIFADNRKKILKFSTPKISFFSRFFATLRFSYYLNLLLITLFCSLALLNIFAYSENYEAIEMAEISKLSALQNFNKLKKASLEDDQKIIKKETLKQESESIERIIDMGKNDDLFGKIEQNFDKIFSDLKFIKKHSFLLDYISYNIPSINSKNISNNFAYEIKFSGKLTNQDGDIEDLLQKFDDLTADMREKMSGMGVKNSSVPRNIDFNKKYYSLPVDFTISAQQ